MCGKAQRNALLPPNCTVTHISHRVVVVGRGIRNGDGATYTTLLSLRQF